MSSYDGDRRLLERNVVTQQGNQSSDYYNTYVGGGSVGDQYSYPPSTPVYTTQTRNQFEAPGYHIDQGYAQQPYLDPTVSNTFAYQQPAQPFYPPNPPYPYPQPTHLQPQYNQQAYSQSPYANISISPHAPSPVIPSPSQPSYISSPSVPQNGSYTTQTQAQAQLISPDPQQINAAPVSSGIKLVIRRAPTTTESTTNPSDMHSSRRASSSRHSVKTEPEQYSQSGRPTRSSRQSQNTRSVYVDRENSEDSDEVIQHRGSTRTGRTVKAPARYGDTSFDEDAFENSMMTSPVVASDNTNQTQRSSARRRLNMQDFAIVPTDNGVTDGGGDGHLNGSPEPRRNGRSRPTRSNGLNRGDDEEDEYVDEPVHQQSTRSKPSRTKSRHASQDDEEDWNPAAEEEDEGSASATETDQEHSEAILDDEDMEESDDYGYGQPARPKRKSAAAKASRANRQPARRSTRSAARAARSMSEDSDGRPKKRELRERTKAVNYRLPPPDITLELEAQELEDITRPTIGSGGFRGGGGGGGPGRKKTSHFTGTLPWLVKSAQRPNISMGDDDSDSDLELMGMKGAASMPAGNPGTAGPAPMGGAGVMKTDVPNFGRVNPKSNLADVDPLGVDMNVTFDNVGGLDNHINQLKEMVALPLLYPEIYQQFGVTPPRGVLFHGPPGTGKTLLARALAASCSTGSTKIAFFMRKGADVLSKWVGEAERQLRMLFEEARNSQPSIIFFDEIDGLAPVRSSKQDQIHASLVSTLLALMDGMDGRGQVIVIGATNRPDAVDPALRRPGRFDREFYFPLPNKEARKKIIGINTRKWSPGVSDEMLDQLAGLTKGYGGADLRSLCTEAALNAVQRRYPQIYSSTDRLLLDPSSIKVGAKDFMMSVKKIIPSSARSASSAAAPLPPHLVPILEDPLDRLKSAVDKVLPRHQTKTALEEAQYEDDIGDDLDSHAMVHALDKMRTYRPRILVHGPAGMGQTYLGPAILHHLEGFHVQNLDLGTLMGDSTSTVEASLVQLFVEAKRHQPSVLFIPSLLPWCIALSDTARTTFKALLDSVPSSDAVLLLAITDGSISDLPRDVKKWFGIGKEGRVELTSPSRSARKEYFASLIDTFRKPPTSFPDALPKRKRILEVLPIAPPPKPKEPSQEEIEREEKELLHTRNILHWSFAGLWPDIPKKFDRYARAAQDGAKAMHKLWLDSIADAKAQQAAIDARRAEIAESAALNGQAEEVTGTETVEQMSASAPAILSTTSILPPPVPPAPAVPPSQSIAPASTLIQDLFSADSPPTQPPLLPEIVVAGHDPSALPPLDQNLDQDLVDVEIPPEPTWLPHTIDFDIIQTRLNSHKYFTPQDFKEDIEKIVENATNSQNPMLITKAKELHTVIDNHIRDFDHVTWGPKFERYKVKMLERKAKKAEKRRIERERLGDAVGGKGGGTEQADQIGVSAGDGQAGPSSGLKRSREDGEGEETDRLGKRQKSMEMEVDGDGNGPSISVETSFTAPSTSNAANNPLPIPSVASPLPAPTPAYPPFQHPEFDLQMLEQDLADRTERLNVDLLEQVRAGCYDRIWRARGEWDRKEVVRETRDWVGEFMREVEEMEGEKGEEEEEEGE